MPSGLMSGPPETRQRCVNGCEKHYECRAKACNQDNLCEGRAYTCAVCEEDFCFDHVKDVNAKSELEARYVCVVCVVTIAVLEVAA